MEQIGVGIDENGSILIEREHTFASHAPNTERRERVRQPDE